MLVNIDDNYESRIHSGSWGVPSDNHESVRCQAFTAIALRYKDKTGVLPDILNVDWTENHQFEDVIYHCLQKMLYDYELPPGVSIQWEFAPVCFTDRYFND